MLRPTTRTLCLALAALSSLATAATVRAPPTRVDPAIAQTFQYAAAHEGQVPPWFDDRPDPLRPPGMLPVVVRPTRDELPLGLTALLARAGVAADDFAPLHGGAPLASGAYSLWLSERGFERLAEDARLERVSLDLPRRRLALLDASRRETGIDTALRALLARDGVLLDGRGVTIADLDTGIWVQHPALFRADAGAFAWVDLDGDGVFTPGKDGVDLDGDGVPEVVHRWATRGAGIWGPAIIDTGATFRPELDFLFIDVNGNGVRDTGAGFDEATPAWGEPLFIADDADGNGRLDASERLLRLGTSKVKAVHAGTTWVRGDAEHGLNAWVSQSTSRETSHGTAVAGILVGGVWGASRLLGLAPGAQLLVYDIRANPASSQTAAVQWAIDEGADVILTEYATYVDVPLDGSTEEERLLDAAVARGIVAVSGAGNLGGSGKHASVTARPNAQYVYVDTDAGFAGSRYIFVTMLERDTDTALSLAVVLPSGASVTFEPGGPQVVQLEGITVHTSRERTSRGTTKHTLSLAHAQPLPMGAYAVSLAAPSAPATGVPLELYVADGRQDWQGGATFRRPTEGKNVCHPATADGTLAVAAYTLHGEALHGGSSAAGDIAPYSSSGPLLHGGPGIALAAPDNPMAPTFTGSGNLGSVSYAPFSGTSGAGPHVAAAAALLRQAYPTESAAQLRARLVDSAKRVAGGPTTSWGAGKLDAAAALGVSVGTGAAPTGVRIELPTQGLTTGRNRLRVAVDGGGEGLRAQWDFDYDGRPDTAWLEGASVDARFDTPGPRAIRVYVANAQGYVAGASLVTEVKGPARTLSDGGTGSGATTHVNPVAQTPTGCGCDTPASSTGAFALLVLAVLGLRRRWARRPPGAVSRA